MVNKKYLKITLFHRLIFKLFTQASLKKEHKVIVFLIVKNAENSVPIHAFYFVQ